MAIICVQAISHIQCRQLGLLHYIGAGYLTYIISTAWLSPLILSSLSSQMAIICVQAILHIQYRQLGSLHYIGCRLSHLYNINCLALTSPSPLSLSSQMAIICVQAISHIQYRQLGSLHYIGAGYLTYIISAALLSPLILLCLSLIW